MARDPKQRKEAGLTRDAKGLFWDASFVARLPSLVLGPLHRGRRRGSYRSLGFILAFLLALAMPAVTLADEPDRVGLVVQFGDGQVEALCLALPAGKDRVTGADLLASSGLDVVLDVGSSMGVMVCQIGGAGCAYPAEPCFCQCTGGSPCTYWNYFYRDVGQAPWTYSALGAGARRIRPGMVDGWVWGDGRTAPGDEWTFETICARPTAAPTPTLAVTTEPPATTAVPTKPPSAAATSEVGSGDHERRGDEEGRLLEGKTKEQAVPAVRAPLTVVRPSATEIGAPPQSAIEDGPDVWEYWPFALMLSGLAVVGAFARLRRRKVGT